MSPQAIESPGKTPQKMESLQYFDGKIWEIIQISISSILMDNLIIQISPTALTNGKPMAVENEQNCYHGRSKPTNPTYVAYSKVSEVRHLGVP